MSTTERLGCARGWEPDVFYEHCTIPAAANFAVGICWLVFGTWLLVSELFLHASSTTSFANYDREKQAIIVLRALFVVGQVISIGPLALAAGE